jgi:ribosome-binding factor A
MAGNSTRARRVGDQLRRELSQLLSRNVADPRVEGVSVSDVELSRDLAHATVFIFCPAGSDHADCLQGLRSASGFMRRHVAREIRLRHVPELHFKIDTTLDHAAHMDALIARAIPAALRDEIEDADVAEHGEGTADPDASSTTTLEGET